MLWKVLWDYHKKIENMLNRYSKGETQLLNSILGEMEVYTAIEEEVVHPVIDAVDPAWVEASQEGNDNLKELAADIQALEPGDPMEPKLMKKLTKQWALHTDREEKRLFPLLKTRLENESYEMARHAWATRQELLAARGGLAPPSQYYIGPPNSGWGKQLVVGGGW